MHTYFSSANCIIMVHSTQQFFSLHYQAALLIHRLDCDLTSAQGSVVTASQYCTEKEIAAKKTAKCTIV